MARAVLACFFILARMAGAASQPCESKVEAPLATQTEVQALRRTLRSSPFYVELGQRFSKTPKCELELKDGNVQVAYIFNDNARLTGKINRSIELSEQRLDLPRIGRQRAIELLMSAERRTYRPRGCGISWKRGEKEDNGDTREVVFRGTSCSCQGRLIYDGKYIAALILKSTC